MATLRTDSPLTRRIVLSFLDFLNSVEVAPGVDREGLEVASQCLMDVFGLDMGGEDEKVRPHLLPDLFASAGLDCTNSNSAAVSKTPNSETVSEVLSEPTGAKVQLEIANDSAFKDRGERSAGETRNTDSLEERLFGQFEEGLESAGHFDGVSKGTPEYFQRISKARSIFQETVEKLKLSASSASEHYILAEAFKVQGNNAMAAHRYAEAIDLYTMAISLCGDNAVFYSNRAAAHTQVGKYGEAIGDCNRAIQIDPNYSKAYSRLGLAYYAQGKYQEAIEMGFKKAHTLDPQSKSIQENLQAAQQKLDEDQRRNRQQNTEQEQTHTQSQSSGPGFSASVPFNIQFPQDMENLFPGIANLAAHFSSGDHNMQFGSRGESEGGQNLDGQPEVRLDGNINMTFEGDQIPPQVAGLMQSMLQMFAGAQGQQGSAPENNQSQETSNRG